MLCAIDAGPDPNNRAGTMLMAKAPPTMLIKYRTPALLANFIRPPAGAGPVRPDSIFVAGMTAIDLELPIVQRLLPRNSNARGAAFSLVSCERPDSASVD